jgi:hypothetical protein
MFVIFGVFFVLCKHFLEFPEFVFALKNISKNLILSYLAEPPGPQGPWATQARKSHGHGRTPLLGVRATPGPTRAPI